MSGNKGMENLILVINKLQDRFSPFGIEMQLELPQIIVIGSQSAGKSSVLESFVGHDFLPRGSGIVTRRPLILQLINNEHSFECEMYAEFSHKENQKFRSFEEIRKEIENETNRLTGTNFGISSKPINLKIYSPKMVNLTLIDLPGLTKNPIGDQPQDIEEKIRTMIIRYIDNKNSLILAVTDAGQDLSTSDALQLAKRADPSCQRTIGVLTKLDLMDQGKEADIIDILGGKLLPLKRGYFAVINRSQKDIESKKSIDKALKDEADFFKKFGLSQFAKQLGTKNLQEYLNKELSEHIEKKLPSIRITFMNNIRQLESELLSVQRPEVPEKIEVTLSELNEVFREKFEVSIGRSANVKVNSKVLSGGTRIKTLINSKYHEEIEEIVSDENEMMIEISIVIQNIRGIYERMFIPENSFDAIVRNQIDLLRNPSLNCIDAVTAELEEIIKECTSSITKYPDIRKVFTEHTINYLQQCREECKAKMNYNVDVHMSYMNILHEDFDEEINIFEQYENKEEKTKVKPVMNRSSGIHENSQASEKTERSTELSASGLYINNTQRSYSDVNSIPTEIRQEAEIIKQRVDSYFKIMKMIFKDYTKKLIKFALIDATLHFIAVYLRERIKESSGNLKDLIREDPHEEYRDKLTKQLNAYKDAIATIDEMSNKIK